MAEKEYDDEYQFNDFDTMDTEVASETDSDSDSEVSSQPSSSQGKTNVMRNALIVIGIAALLMLGYRFAGSFFSTNESTIQEIPSIPPTSQAPPSPQPIQQTKPALQVPEPPPAQPRVEAATQPSVDLSLINQQFSSLEANQQDMQAEVTSVNSKLSGINSNVNDLAEKIAKLNQMLSDLTAKLDQQSSEITVLTERTRPKPKHRPTIRRRHTARVFNIQAIIPGRAWLIATNGSTITVREGTQIAGYGVVSLIDAIQGRVLTSSGRVIKFSQQDS